MKNKIKLVKNKHDDRNCDCCKRELLIGEKVLRINEDFSERYTQGDYDLCLLCLQKFWKKISKKEIEEFKLKLIEEKI